MQFTSKEHVEAIAALLAAVDEAIAAGSNYTEWMKARDALIEASKRVTG